MEHSFTKQQKTIKKNYSWFFNSSWWHYPTGRFKFKKKSKYYWEKKKNKQIQRFERIMNLFMKMNKKKITHFHWWKINFIQEKKKNNFKNQIKMKITKHLLSSSMKIQLNVSKESIFVSLISQTYLFFFT